MAYNSVLKSVTVGIEVEAGHTDAGAQIFRKRNYSGIKGTATAEQIGIVTAAIKAAISKDSKDVYKNSVEQIKNA